MTEPQAAGRASEFAMARVAERMEFELPASALSAAAQAPAYTMGARLLHWVTAALILVMIPLGVVIANDWGGALQDQLYDLHRSIGAVLIPIVLLRLREGGVRRLLLGEELGVIDRIDADRASRDDIATGPGAAIVILGSRQCGRSRAEDAESDRHDHGRFSVLEH